MIDFEPTVIVRDAEEVKQEKYQLIMKYFSKETLIGDIRSWCINDYNPWRRDLVRLGFLREKEYKSRMIYKWAPYWKFDELSHLEIVKFIDKYFYRKLDWYIDYHNKFK